MNICPICGNSSASGHACSTAKPLPSPLDMAKLRHVVLSGTNNPSAPKPPRVCHECGTEYPPESKQVECDAGPVIAPCGGTILPKPNK